MDNNFIIKYFSEQGCILLDQYVRSTQKMKFICSCGNQSEVSWEKFRRGQRCKECAKKRMQTNLLTYDEVVNVFKNKGCELLENVYKNSKTPMQFKCSCGNISKTTLSNFKNGVRCRKCGKNKQIKKLTFTMNDVKKIFQDQGCELLSKYTGANKPLKYQCNCGAISTITLSNFKMGKRCKKCGNNKISEKNSGSNSVFWNSNRDEIKLRELIRGRTRSMLKSSLKAICSGKYCRTKELLGYSYRDLFQHITTHINWNKIRNLKWHLDHYFPICAFVKYNITDLKIINCLENLQPILASNNLKKSGKFNKKEFEDWLLKKNVSFTSKIQ